MWESRGAHVTDVISETDFSLSTSSQGQGTNLQTSVSSRQIELLSKELVKWQVWKHSQNLTVLQSSIYSIITCIGIDEMSSMKKALRVFHGDNSIFLLPTPPHRGQSGRGDNLCWTALASRPLKGRSTIPTIQYDMLGGQVNNTCQLMHHKYMDQWSNYFQGKEGLKTHTHN